MKNMDSCREKINSLTEENATPEKIEEVKKYIESTLKDEGDLTVIRNELGAKIKDIETINAQKAQAKADAQAKAAEEARKKAEEEQKAGNNKRTEESAITREQFENASADELERMISETYHSYRDANYTYEESVGRITQDELQSTTVTPEKAFVWYHDGWLWRHNANHYGSKYAEVDRISLNVKADLGLLEELDNLILNGQYLNKNGKLVKVNIPEGSYYKTEALIEDWGTRQDPITMYFPAKLSPEVVDIIADITKKYARTSANAKPLLGATENRPWMAHCPEPTAEDFKALYNEALKLNKNLADAIRMRCDKNWYSSYGDLQACRKILNDYKQAMTPKPSGTVPKSNWTWEMSDGLGSHGFKRNSNAKTNINNITADDVCIRGNNVSGHTVISGKSQVNRKQGSLTKPIDTDIHAGLPDGVNEYAVYNSEADITLIGIRSTDYFGRPATFSVQLKGQVSETDAIALINHLKSKNMMPSNLKGVDLVEVRKMGNKIREEVANFFNTLSKNAPKRNVVKKTNVNAKELALSEKNKAGGSGYNEYKKSNWNQTEIASANGVMNSEEVGFGNWRTGYDTRTPNVPVIDIRANASRNGVMYNETTGATIIYAQGKSVSGYKRPFDSLIRVQGKVSEADAKALLAYLDKKVPNFRGKDVNPADVQKYVAEFFNTL